MVKVKFKNNGEEVEVPEGEALKEVTKDKGWPSAYGCEDGVCGTCIVKVSDKESVSPMESTEEQTLMIMGMDSGEYRLACQCKIKKDTEIEGM